MSLINQVLNDLEKRGASTNIGEATIRVVPLRQKHNTFWLALLAVAVLVLAATAWMKWGSETQVFRNPPAVMANSPAPVLIQPVSQPLASTANGVQVDMAASASQISSPPATVPEKPLVILAPTISAVNPNTATSLDAEQTITVSGSYFANDATLVLRTPRRNVYKLRKIDMQNSGQIVFSANFNKKAGLWSVEVVNPSGHSSGQFTFNVGPAPVVAGNQVQNKTLLSAPKNKKNPAKLVEVEMPSSGINKQPTQMTPQQQAENEFRKAYGLMHKGQIEAAISGFETTLQLDSDHIVARQTLVRLLLDNKRNADAERVLQEGLQYNPKQYSLALLLARIQVGHSELDQALETMQKSLPYAAKQADYQAFVAALLQRQSRHKEAISYFRNALQLSPQSGVWLMGLGISLRAEQRIPDARDAFNRAIESHSLNADLLSFVTQQLKEL